MNNKKPRAFAKFIHEDSTTENGRHIYALVNAYALRGYEVELFETTDFRELGNPGKLIYSIDGVTLVNSVPDNTEDTVYIFDKEDKSCAGKPWRKKVQTGYDFFSNYTLASYRGHDPIMLPYPMHPWCFSGDIDQKLEQARATEKKFRIFFSGDTEGYKKNWINYPKPKLTRRQVIDTILAQKDQRITYIQDQDTLDQMFSGDYRQQAVLVDMSKVYVNDWLNNLAKAEFFICPQGYVMPMCHNSVEAMAVGAIPIINYPEWFSPSLEHMKNCITFDDQGDLMQKLNMVLAMGSEQIAQMRRNAIDYYDTHLSPTQFVKQVEARPEDKVTVLLINDRCSKDHADKLNAKSIIIRDTPLTPDGLLENILYRLIGKR